MLRALHECKVIGMLAFWFEAVLKSLNGLGRPCCEANCTVASVQAIRNPVIGHLAMVAEGRVNTASSPIPWQAGIGSAVSCRRYF